jgi:Rrf2 family protein
MRVTAQLAYGLTALVALARTDGPVKGDTLAAPHDMSVPFLENILGDLRRAGLVRSRRGGQGGYWLARPADTITVADVIHALHGTDPLDATTLDHLTTVWQSITKAYIDAAESITLATLAHP